MRSRQALQRILVAVCFFGIFRPSTARADDRVRACIDASTRGQTLRDAGKLVEARAELIACARDACPPIVRSHCATWLGEVQGMIPSVVVRVQDATGADVVDARGVVDGQPFALDGKPLPLDPGEHVVAAHLPGGTTIEEHVLLVAAEHARLVTLRMKAPRAAPPPPAEAGAVTTHHVPVGAWVLGGAGVVALGVGAYFVSAASDQMHHLQQTCSPFCTHAQTQSGRTDSLVADLLLGAGGAAVAVAVVWAAAFPSSTVDVAGAHLSVAPLAGGALTTLGARF